MSFYRAYRYEAPAVRIHGLMSRLSRNRVIHEQEAKRIITKAAERWSKNPSQTIKAFLNSRYRWARWAKGRLCCDSGLVEWEFLEEEARRNKAQFINIQSYKIRKLFQSENAAIENRRLINQIKEQIKNG